ncbi:MAG: hydrogenase expression/formation protein HypE [Desulfovibrio sp.]|jgi:hydrogenase expression/formation protein HypE|nr:hydrogenase expression/formation protein HypE [Desulfovibrio sp.]
MSEDYLLLEHGSGGRAAQRLIRDLFLPHFANPVLERMDDAAYLEAGPGALAMSTDGYTVDPVEFPGGDIGCLAVHGTVNDVSMLGARPLYLSCAFIMEEGLPLSLLERLARSMGKAARAAGVLIVTGDTKVVPRGAADKIFIVSTGIGRILAEPAPGGARAAVGDAVLVSGQVGEHGLTILTAREGIRGFAGLRSDCASLNHLVEALIREIGNIHVLRDPTRGGLATALGEIAVQSGTVCRVRERDVPVRAETAAACSLLGLDPLYLANEGKLICILPAAKAEAALTVLRRFPEGRAAACIGTIEAPGAGTRSGQTVLETAPGGRRLLPILEGEPLPRIC